jgi:hypothetical protein
MNTIDAFQDYGIPVKAVVGGGPWAGRDGKGRPCLYAVMGHESNPADLIILQIDVESGACRQFAPPPGITSGRPCLWSERHGKLFIGASGREHVGPDGCGWLVVFDPKTEHAEMAGGGVLCPGKQEMPVSIAEAPDGTIYVGCYPDCGLYAYDPATERLRACGSMDPVDHYGYVACGRDGTVACLIKMTRPHAVVYDPVTNEHRAVGPVADTDAGIGKVVLVHGADGLLYLDTHEGPFRLQGLEAVPVPALPPAPPPPALPDGSRFRFLDGHAEKAHAWRLVEIRRPDGSQKVIHLDYESAGTGIYIVRAGPDKKLYGSSVLPMHFFTADPATGALKDYGACSTASGEAYSMDWLNGKLYLAVYTHAILCEYDPQRPYSFSSLRQNPQGELEVLSGTYDPSGNLGFQFTPEDNPRQLGRMDSVAYRSRDMVAGPAGKVWVVSIPDYGMWGGTLSWYDPATRRFGGGHRHLYPDCSPISITYMPEEDLLFMGFSIYGGSGTMPRVASVGWMAWDPNRDREVWRGDFGVKSVGSMDVHAVGQGRVYAIVHPVPESVLRADLLLLEPLNGRILSQTRLDTAAGWPLEVSFANDDRYLYGLTRESVYRVPLGTTDIEVLWRTDAETGPTAAGALLDGMYYFGALARLQGVRVSAARPQP